MLVIVQSVPAFMTPQALREHLEEVVEINKGAAGEISICPAAGLIIVI